MITADKVELTARDGATSRATLHSDPSLPRGTAFIIMHPTSDWQRHYILPLLAARGFGALGCANRYAAREAELILENTILDWAAGVDHLRSVGYRNIVGIGNSGGGEIAVGYHSEAMRPSIRGTPLGDPPDLTRQELAPLDGIVLLNAHVGRPQSLTRSLDPSVGGDSGNDPTVYDRSLDMYDPRNGPPFSAAFRERHWAAQIERNHKITRWCRAEIERIDRAGNPLMKDIPFIVHRTDANLSLRDLTLDPTDRSGETIWDEDPQLANYTPGPLRGNRTRLRIMTLRSWISQRSLATSQFDVMKFLPQCKVPTLVACGTADAGGSEHSRLMFEAAPDPGKTMVWIKGGTHFMRGQEDKQEEAADRIAAWARARNLA
jgi:pimeloyl-ACP methyl ester carboxylesterase